MNRQIQHLHKVQDTDKCGTMCRINNTTSVSFFRVGIHHGYYGYPPNVYDAIQRLMNQYMHQLHYHRPQYVHVYYVHPSLIHHYLH
ncbi:hypothetical protein IUJ58_19160 [Priestia aryabhattai]|uniref:hypothetical protein n=1 Tax=Priestia aryabhattai TaxID=412384 RepID=UPI001C0D44C9|nr:hypothetical protein [Priestia aryabhattai]MBU3573107.1 hypothetical protein [Priestia aryabhattai]WDL86069.1 hypothetical protein IUJ58_19160 [Priestia aryabhattai]